MKKHLLLAAAISLYVLAGIVSLQIPGAELGGAFLFVLCVMLVIIASIPFLLWLQMITTGWVHTVVKATLAVMVVVPGSGAFRAGVLVAVLG